MESDEDILEDDMPILLKNISNSIISQNRTYDTIATDFLFAAVVATIIESGFILVDDNIEIIDPIIMINKMQLLKWKQQNGIYQAIFIVTDIKNVPVKLIITPMGHTTLINLVIKDINSETYSVCLPIKKYISYPESTTISKIYLHLKEIQLLLKDRLIGPVKSKVLSHCGFPSASLTGLPEELIYKIMLYLQVGDVVDVAKTCPRLKVLLDNESFWHEMYTRDFNKIPCTESNNWKISYRDVYLAEQERKLKIIKRLAGTMHDFMDYSDYVSYVDNPQWEADYIM